jgi:hypothetical protein
MNIKKSIPVLLMAMLTVLLVGCGSQGTTLTGTDRESVLAFTEPMSDNLLTGMNAGDYAVFSRDFDVDMSKAMTASQFADLKKDRDAKLGLYISRQVSSVTESGGFYIVVYDAKFEKDSAVVVRIVFRVDEPHQVSGLWFSK